MHPTANSAAFIENLGGFEIECAVGDAGRYVSALRISEDARRRRAVESIVA